MKDLMYSALILAGGRSSRLGGVPKALLSNGSTTLLGGVLAACQEACTRIVVGPESLALPTDVLRTREEPAFSGPAAGISAGLRALTIAHPDSIRSPEHWVLVLSCDLPRADAAVPLLLQAAASAPEHATGYWAVSEATTQPLLGIYRTVALIPAFAGDTANASVRRFLAPLAPAELHLPTHITADIDTWEAARAAGYTQAPPQP